MRNSVQRLARTFGVLLATLLLLSGCGRQKAQAPDLSGSAEPDKVLFESAMRDIDKGKHNIARLTLQTLINTYPDSEYLAKAMLAIGDSFYEEGCGACLPQAISQYKDFITFFPFLEEAVVAQFRIGMAHYRRMEKPDRDRTQARLAEEEFQVFLQKHGDHKLAAEAEQRLREVQEVLAEGDYRICRFYYLKDTVNAYRAAAFRCADVVDRYPLYSQSDRALWMLGQSLEKLEQGQLATRYYSRIVRDYPLSELVNNAKQRLEKLGVPIPQPDPAAIARMQQERECDRTRPGLLKRGWTVFKTNPDVSDAACTGKPNLTPPGDSFNETLRTGGEPGAVGPGSTGSSVTVETVPPSGANPPATGATENKPAADSVSGQPTAKLDPKQAEKQKKEEDKRKKEEAKKKKEEEEKKKKAESSSKKKGLRRILPW
jgi:outer membrane protein assembly factor BamD